MQFCKTLKEPKQTIDSSSSRNEGMLTDKGSNIWELKFSSDWCKFTKIHIAYYDKWTDVELAKTQLKKRVN